MSRIKLVRIISYRLLSLAITLVLYLQGNRAVTNKVIGNNKITVEFNVY
jgi:hypothetical protein